MSSPLPVGVGTITSNHLARKGQHGMRMHQVAIEFCFGRAQNLATFLMAFQIYYFHSLRSAPCVRYSRIFSRGTVQDTCTLFLQGQSTRRLLFFSPFASTVLWIWNGHSKVLLLPAVFLHKTYTKPNFNLVHTHSESSMQIVENSAIEVAVALEGIFENVQLEGAGGKGSRYLTYAVAVTTHLNRFRRTKRAVSFGPCRPKGRSPSITWTKEHRNGQISVQTLPLPDIVSSGFFSRAACEKYRRRGIHKWITPIKRNEQLPAAR